MFLINDFTHGKTDWLKQISLAARPIKSATQIWVATSFQYGIPALVSQTSFREETSGGVAKCELFTQADMLSEMLSSKKNGTGFRFSEVKLML